MVVLWVIFFLLLVVLGISYWTYRIAFYSSRRDRIAPDLLPETDQYRLVADDINRASSVMQRYSFESITISARDGIPLFGRYYHVRDGAPIEILFHGYRSSAFRDCCGGHALARSMGFNTLVVDQRARGNSGGSTITFGVKERFDCLCWVEYLNKRFGSSVPIIMSGISMGAATVLMTLDLPLPDNVACILADSPYSSPAAIISKVCKDRHYPVALSYPFLHLGAMIFGGFRLGHRGPVDSVKHARIPVFLIHGEADDFVPYEMTIEIGSACASEISLHIIPGAGHGLSFMVEPQYYEHAVYEFLKSVPNITISPDFDRKHQ